jgi:hypothetical protein
VQFTRYLQFVLVIHILPTGYFHFYVRFWELFIIMHYNVSTSLAFQHIAFSVGGVSLAQCRHLHTRILPSGKWDCRVQKVKFTGDFDFDCFGQKPGVNRHLANRFTLELNVLLIGITKQSCLNIFIESVTH